MKAGKRKFSFRIFAAFLCLFVSLGAGAAIAAGGEAGHGAAAEHGAAQGGGHGEGHGGGQMKDFMWRWIDFAVMAGILVWAVKKADMKGALVRRRENIGKLLEEANQARETAEAKLREYTGKLEKANREVEEISAAISAEGEMEKARIIAEAKATAEKIKQQARVSAEQEVQRARAELRAEAARLAVELAEQKIRQNIGKSDQDRLVEDYLAKVELQ